MFFVVVVVEDIVNHLNEFNDWQRPHYEGFVQLKKLFVKHITEMASVEFTPSEQQQRSLCTGTPGVDKRYYKIETKRNQPSYY